MYKVDTDLIFGGLKAQNKTGGGKEGESPTVGSGKWSDRRRWRMKKTQFTLNA